MDAKSRNCSSPINMFPNSLVRVQLMPAWPCEEPRSGLAFHRNLNRDFGHRCLFLIHCNLHAQSPRYFHNHHRIIHLCSQSDTTGKCYARQTSAQYISHRRHDHIVVCKAHAQGRMVPGILYKWGRWDCRWGLGSKVLFH